MNKNRLSKPYILIPLALLCCLLWGSAFPSIKVGYSLFGIGAEDTFSQIYFAGIRFALAGVLVILLGSVISKKPLYPKSRAECGHILILSLFQTILQYVMFYMGLAHTTGVKSSILVSVNVFLSLVISAVVFRGDKLSASKVTGAVLGFAGVVLINFSSASSLFGFSLKGEGAMLASAFAYSVSSVLIKLCSKTDNPVMLSGWQFFTGGIVMLVLGKALGGNINTEACRLWQAALILLYLSLISAVAYTIWGLLLKYNPVSRVAVIGFMNPVFGVLLSAIVLGETAEAFSIKNLASLVLVSVGIFLANKKQNTDKQ